MQYSHLRKYKITAKDIHIDSKYVNCLQNGMQVVFSFLLILLFLFTLFVFITVMFECLFFFVLFLLFGKCVFSLKWSISLWSMNKRTIFICIVATYYCHSADTHTFLFPVKHAWNIYSNWTFQPCVTIQYYVYGILNILCIFIYQLICI